jgi:CheY-like chemotaxis protein
VFLLRHVQPWIVDPFHPSSPRPTVVARKSAMDRNVTILIAEDSEDDALLLQHAFRNLGLQNPIQIVTDGEQVIRYLQGSGKFADRQQFPFPSVPFLDVKMPKMGGFHVLGWFETTRIVI